MRRHSRWLVPFALSSMALAAHANSAADAIDPAGVAHLVADSGGTTEVSIHSATGAARFVRTAPQPACTINVFHARSIDEQTQRSLFPRLRSVAPVADPVRDSFMFGELTELARRTLMQEARGGLGSG